MTNQMNNKNNDRGRNTAPALVAALFFVLGFLKSSLLPMLSTAKFVKNDILGSAKHDAKIFAVISFLLILSVVLGVLLWITLAAGLVIWAIAGTGPVLLAWAYIFAFEFVTLIILALTMALLKSKLKVPESLDRAEKLLKIK